MAAARSQRVDANVTLYDHCISRSVRHVALRPGIVFSPVMDNHLRVPVWLDPNAAAEGVLRRWLARF